MRKSKRISKLIKKGSLKSNQDKVYKETEGYLQKFPKLSKTFIRDVRLLFKYFTDRKIPTTNKVVAVGALLYFITPIDAIPDLVPFLGFTDDIGVVGLAIKYYADKLEKYKKLT